MSDRPDFTSNTALNAVADTLDNLPVSINAQTLGSLAVDIAAQSAGDIDINLNTNSVGSLSTTIDGQSGDVGISFNSQTGNVDINFQNQTDGVESGTEFAARQGSAFTRQETFQLSGNTTTSKTLSSSFPSSPFVLEGVMLTARGAFVPGLFARFLVDSSGNGFTDQQIPLQAQSGSIVLDPGLRLDSGGSVDLFADNPSSQSTLVEATGLFREL
jgi:hypothetical protein